MKRFGFLTISLFIIMTVASETAIKNSAPFSFPTSVGVTWKTSSSGKDLSFVSQTHYAVRTVVELSWSVPGKMEKGSIFVFNLAGSKMKTFPLCSREGSVQWDVASGKKIAKGIYFARLACGSYQKNVKIIIN